MSHNADYDIASAKQGPAEEPNKASSAQQEHKDRESKLVSDLVAEAKKGDKRAFQALVERYQQRAFKIAYNILRNQEDAEDVIQESFVKAYLSLATFRGQAAFYTWFYRIVYNMAIDLKRKSSRISGTFAELNEEKVNSKASDTSFYIGPTEEDPYQAIYRKEQAKEIYAALDKLSDEHRTAVLLREYDGLNYDDIAKVVGVSKGTVMSRLHYARKKLQKSLTAVFGGQAAEDEPVAVELEKTEEKHQFMDNQLR